MSDIKGSIIIPTKDKLSRLFLVLKALEDQVNNNVEVIVVFDGCRPETVEKFNKIRFSYTPDTIVSEENIGRAAARNLGLSKASGEIIIFLDDDRIPCSDFVSRHLNGHREKCVLLGERKEVFYTEEEINELLKDYLFSNNFDILMAHAGNDSSFNLFNKFALTNSKCSLRWVPFYTGNVSIEKQDLEAVGMFDEKYTGWGYEDTDLGYRLCKYDLKFIKDSLLINYHLVHKENRKSRRNDELKNEKYFLEKYDYQPELVITIYLLKFLRKFAIIKHIGKTLLYRNPKYRSIIRV